MNKFDIVNRVYGILLTLGLIGLHLLHHGME